MSLKWYEVREGFITGCIRVLLVSTFILASTGALSH